MEPQGGITGSPPGQLDGADVLWWAVSRRGLFHTIPHRSSPTDEGVICVAAMAICRYAGGDRYYLFKCDRDWEVVFDWDAGSEEEAQAVAANPVEGESLEWQPYSLSPP